MKRWTINQLAAISEKDFILKLLYERLDGLSNPYSPLAGKLTKAIEWLEKQATE